MNERDRQGLIVSLAELLQEWARDLNDESTDSTQWADSWSQHDVEAVAGCLALVHRHVQDAVARKQEHPA